MFFKKKEVNLEKIKDSKSNEISPIVHDRPLICMFDLKEEIYKDFTKHSYNCTKGTIGSLVKVPNKSRHDKHFLKLNYSAPSNLHEHDVFIFDMGVNNEVDYDEEQLGLDKVTGKATFALLSTFPEKIFNPKPFATTILSKDINALLKKESVIIIFADRHEKVEYQKVEINSNGYDLFDQIKITNTCFYDGFPDCYNKNGRKIRAPEEQTKLTPLLLKYTNDSHYELAFNHPTHWDGKRHEKDDNFIPLLLNNDGEIVSFYHAHGKSGVFIFPQIKNKKDFLLELFNNHLTDIFPKLFSFHGQFGWLDNGDYPLPGELELLQKREDIERKYQSDITTNEQALENIKTEYQFLRNMLSESGDVLVKAVEHYFSWLDFESVINVDDTNPEVLEEDFQVDCGDRFLVVEVKGIGGTSTDKDCSQISKIRYRRAEQRGKFDVFGLYIVNHQRYMPPESRQNPPFTENQIKDAILDKRGLLTTYELFRAYFLIEEGILKKEDVRNKMFETGLIQLSPSNLKSLGIPDEYFMKSHVVILNLDDITLKKGEYLIAKKGNDYSKLKIESLKVNDVDVEEASSGEVGVKVSKKIKAKSEIFVQV